MHPESYRQLPSPVGEERRPQLDPIEAEGFSYMVQQLDIDTARVKADLARLSRNYVPNNDKRT